MVDGLLPELAEVVGPANVLTDPDVVAGYSVDWTGRFRGSTPAVVRPGSTQEVAAVLRICNRAGVVVVPQGGNTGLVGGGVPLAGEVVLSLARLAHLDDVDSVAAQVTAGAGVSIGRLQAAATQAGLAYGVDLASRDTATVGGTIATNAAGLRALRYGDTRAQLVGVEAVLAHGEVVSHLGGIVRDNTGYHLPSLLCGSEGTLAVVTRARLRLVPRYDERVVALLAFGSVDAALAAATSVRSRLSSLDAAELFLQTGLDLVAEVTGLPAPFPGRHVAYLLVEAADRVDPTDALSEAIGALAGVADVAVAAIASARQRLWAYRERHTEAINSIGTPHKLDVALPAAGISAFVAEAPGLIHSLAPEARTWIFGHAADGNLHVNVTGLAPDDERVDEVVLRLAASHGGSISAEHGIGTAKRRWLWLNRSDAEISAFRTIKTALDPGGILNPNVLLPPRP